MSKDFKKDVERGDYHAGQLKAYFEKSGKDNWFDPNPYPGNAIESQYKGFDSKTHYESVEKNPAWQRLYDVDWIVTNDKGQKQRHEAKWNEETHGKNNPRQNIVIETVSSVENYDGGTFAYYDSGKDGWNTDWVENPKTGKKEKILKGVGWYRKREKVLRLEDDGTERIVTNDNDMADWFHFYNTIDPAKQLVATDDEIEAFKSDPNIPNGALLLKRFPLDYCISIQRQHLDWMVGQFKASGGEEKPISRGLGFLIPVGEIVPVIIYGQGTEKHLSKPARFYRPESVKVNFIGDDNWERHGSATLDFSKLYAPERLREAAGIIEGGTVKDGGKLIGMGICPNSWNLGQGYVLAYKAKNCDTGEVTFANGSPKAPAAKPFESNFRHDIEFPEFQMAWLTYRTEKFPKE